MKAGDVVLYFRSQGSVTTPPEFFSAQHRIDVTEQQIAFALAAILLGKQMPGAFHLRRHTYPFSGKTQRFKFRFEYRPNLSDAREVFGRAFDVDSLLQQRNRLTGMRGRCSRLVSVPRVRSSCA